MALLQIFHPQFEAHEVVVDDDVVTFLQLMAVRRQQGIYLVDVLEGVQPSGVDLGLFSVLVGEERVDACQIHYFF